jgi:hypothetical protein
MRIGRTSALESLRRTLNTNPISVVANDGSLLVELKKGLVLYLAHPPGPATARTIYDLAMNRFASRIQAYRSTCPGSAPVPWTPSARSLFEGTILPKLRSRMDWGYMFSDGRGSDSLVFMFHGYRPHTEAGMASFVRFDFEWSFDSNELHSLARDLIGCMHCLSGFGGYYLQARFAPKYRPDAFDRVFGLAMRYWGAEAHNLDVSVNHLKDGFKCVNWLTILGNHLRSMAPEVIEQAKRAAHSHFETDHAILLQSELAPRLGDRNRNEWLNGYAAVANALLPLQVTEHAPFGGTLWDEDNTMRYLRRFTHPNDV